MRSPASVMMFSRMSVSSRTPVSRSIISAVDWRNDGLCSIRLAVRSAPSVGLLFFAGLGALLLVVDGDVVHLLAVWVNTGDRQRHHFADFRDHPPLGATRSLPPPAILVESTFLR